MVFSSIDIDNNDEAKKTLREAEEDRKCLGGSMG